jgi:hypothetical protein
MQSFYSIIICSHNPRPNYLRRTLSALEQQTPSTVWSKRDHSQFGFADPERVANGNDADSFTEKLAELAR